MAEFWSKRILLLLFAGCSSVGAQPVSTTNATLRVTRPSLYDESADGTNQIAEALETATKDHLHVLLVFGANNCGWCHRLHTFFETDKSMADVLKSDYVVVMIDVKTDTPNTGKIENWHNGLLLTKYSPVYQGVPFIVILDAPAKPLCGPNRASCWWSGHHRHRLSAAIGGLALRGSTVL